MKVKGMKDVIYPGVAAGSYKIDIDGNVYHFERTTGELTPIQIKTNSNGYKYVSLESGENPKKKLRITLHRLLALAFVPRTQEDIEMEREAVHFIDFNKDNVTVDNLEWVSNLELKVLSDAYKNACLTLEDFEPYISILLDKGYSIGVIVEVFDIKGFLTKRMWKRYIKNMIKHRV